MPPCRSCSGARRGSLTNLKSSHDAEHPRKEEAPRQRGPEFPIFGKGDRHGCLGASVRLERRCVLPLSQIRHLQSQGLRRKRQRLCRFGYLAHDRLCGGPQPVPHVQRRHGRNVHLQSQGPHPTDDQRGWELDDDITWNSKEDFVNAVLAGTSAWLARPATCLPMKVTFERCSWPARMTL